MEQWMKALTCAGYEYMKLMVSELQRQLDEIEGSNVPAQSTLTPKPPPRRQNPFNRPAPAVPRSSSSKSQLLPSKQNEISEGKHCRTYFVTYCRLKELN